MIKYNGKLVTEGLVQIIRKIDEICKANNLQYFAWGKLLIYCVHYAGVMDAKDESVFDIGLEREDYDKLIEILKQEDVKEDGLIFSQYVENHAGRKYKRLLPRLGIRIHINNDDVESTATFWVTISPFDAIPSDFDVRSSFFRVMKRANKTYKQRTSCRQFIEKRGKKGRLARFIRMNLRYRWRNQQKIMENVHKKAKKYSGTPAGLIGRVVAKRGKYIKKEALYPLQELPFGDITLPCPRDYSAWTVLFDEKEKERTRTIQEIDLQLLKEFDRVCRLIGVDYFICGGTMLGYVRNGGFIPWDDDIDVGMLRADYNQFLQKGGKYLSDKFFLQTRQSDPKIPYLFSKVRMNGTEYLTKYNELRSFHKGVCLDLFPFDYIPNDIRDQKLFRREAKIRARKHHYIANRQKGEPTYDGPPKNFEERYWRFIGKCHRYIFHRRSLQVTQRRYDQFVTQYNDRAKELGLTEVASFVPTYTHAMVEDMIPCEDIVFEGVQAKLLKDADKFLTMQYGDYMQLPPKHQQVGHRLVSFDIIHGDDNQEDEQESEE